MENKDLPTVNDASCGRLVMRVVLAKANSGYRPKNSRRNEVEHESILSLWKLGKSKVRARLVVVVVGRWSQGVGWGIRSGMPRVGGRGVGEPCSSAREAAQGGNFEKSQLRLGKGASSQMKDIASQFT
jgi:hypothetical protein